MIHNVTPVRTKKTTLGPLDAYGLWCVSGAVVGSMYTSYLCLEEDNGYDTITFAGMMVNIPLAAAQGFLFGGALAMVVPLTIPAYVVYYYKKRKDA